MAGGHAFYIFFCPRKIIVVHKFSYLLLCGSIAWAKGWHIMARGVKSNKSSNLYLFVTSKETYILHNCSQFALLLLRLMSLSILVSWLHNSRFLHTAYCGILKEPQYSTFTFTIYSPTTILEFCISSKSSRLQFWMLS